MRTRSCLYRGSRGFAIHWRREAQRAADRAAELRREGFSVGSISSTLGLSLALVSLMLEGASAAATAEEGEGVR